MSEPGGSEPVAARQRSDSYGPVTTDGGNGDHTQVQALADRLLETAKRHDVFEKAAPPHDWWDWYAAYLHGRGNGMTADAAAHFAGRYMAEEKHVAVPTT